MDKTELVEIKKGEYGTGLLIENDGYISMSETSHNKKLYEDASARNEKGEWYVPNPFIVDAVFQKFDIKNANGRIYPEKILKKQVELYQQKINEHRAYGECFKPYVSVYTKTGWWSFDRIKRGELVFTFNCDKKEIELQPVKEVIEKDFDGNMIRIKGKQINALVTPHHKFPVFRMVFGCMIFHAHVDACELQKTDGFIFNIYADEKQEEYTHISELEFSEEYYKGKVMCIDVENHTFIVSCDGKKCLSSNCNHPAESTIDLGRISHNIVELHWEGHTLVGKMELNISEGFRRNGICSSYGDTVALLLLNGYKIGVSSRGVGSVEQRLGQTVVGNDFELICWDVVSDPSTPGAYIGKSENLQQYVENNISTQNGKNKLRETIDKLENILL